MKWSKSYLFTSKDAPADAEVPSHKLMSRAGLIRKVAPGIYTYGNLALRSIRKFEKILREELERCGSQEILMPMVQPASLWEETGRWAKMGAGLLKFENRNQHPFCLGATHEEVVTDYVRKDIKSYRDLPASLYQIQTKYRDEIRPRFGLMRGREFIMKDAYSFDADKAGALKNYDIMFKGYQAIFQRLQVKFRVVQADAGAIGGSQTHEFQLLADSGEDHLMVCDTCDYASNIEVAPALGSKTAPLVATSPNLLPLEAFPTPGLKAISTLAKALSLDPSELVKTLFFSANDGTDPNNKDLKAVCVLVRGSDEVNPIKLKNLLGLPNPPLLLTDEEVKKTSGAWPGSCGPVGLTIPVYLDQALKAKANFVVGANRDAEHLRNVNIGRDFTPTAVADLRLAREGDACPSCENGHYKSFRGIEVGHVFYLGSLYSAAMNANYINAEGELKPLEMGCYGIGVSRTIQAVIEQSHDTDGIIWPVAIAPFTVHMVVLDPKDEAVVEAAELLYSELTMRGHDVFMDDRDERPGVKFKDADLLGFPVRLNVGARGLQAGEIEMISRKTKAMLKVRAESAVEAVEKLLTELKSNAHS
jgi:prolyl-tRNA synthetase